MHSRNDTKYKNTKLVKDVMQLADRMLAMAQIGITECEDDSCLLIYGTIRDCGYKIRRAVEQEHLFDDAERSRRQILH